MVTLDGRKRHKRPKFPTILAAIEHAIEQDRKIENRGRRFAADLSDDETAAISAWRNLKTEKISEGVAVESLSAYKRRGIEAMRKAPDGRKIDQELVEKIVARKVSACCCGCQALSRRVNFLGAIDNGSGHWAPGHAKDAGQPNSNGHREMFADIVPTLFDAIVTGKAPTAWDGTTGYLRLQQDIANPDPFSSSPDRKRPTLRDETAIFCGERRTTHLAFT